MSSIYKWDYSFNPQLPLYVFPYLVQGYQDKMHWHDYYEIGVCLKGTGKFLYMNKEYPVEAGDIVINNNFENHVAVTQEGQEMEYIFFIFMPSFIANLQGRTLDLSYLFPFDYNPIEFENKIDHATETAKEMGWLIQEALVIYEEGSRFMEMKLDILLRQILLCISEHYLGQSASRKAGHNYVDIRIQDAISFMNAHYNEAITVELLAQTIGVSPSYFRHRFKEDTRVSFKQYLTHMRMSHAKKLLLSTDKTVSEIIFEVGYSNENQFYSVFKKFMSLSPAEFRRQYRRIASRGERETCI